MYLFVICIQQIFVEWLKEYLLIDIANAVRFLWFENLIKFSLICIVFIVLSVLTLYQSLSNNQKIFSTDILHHHVFKNKKSILKKQLVMASLLDYSNLVFILLALSIALRERNLFENTLSQKILKRKTSLIFLFFRKLWNIFSRNKKRSRQVFTHLSGIC